ncbi:MAG: MFS transporter [Planctomycetes bacterium]|nr:MFS transporter [Planctomycetota bacterium]MCH9724075.1 MFS transporter [Planctomycetota bacterium]MCH9778131.1 MFS transporter [Planctomycetota bacterium]MDF1745985.1 MFS transporter [Gimesia sp.]
MTGTENPVQESTAKPLKLRLYLMMFLQYFVQGCYLPIITLYLFDALGFTALQVGVFGAALAVGPLLAPFVFGQIVDRHYATERVLAFCHFSGGVIMLALFVQQSFWPVVILGVLYSILYVPTMMLTNSLTFQHLKDSDKEFPLIRLWGTIGFVIPAWMAEGLFLAHLKGDELNTGRGIVLAMAGVAGLLMAGYCLTLPHTPPVKSDKKDLAPGKVLKMLKYRHFLILVLVAFIISIVHKFYFQWNSPFLNAILGQGHVEGAWEQRISSIGQVFEVIVMAVLGFAIKKYGFKTVMLVGLLSYMVRSLVFAYASTISDFFPLALSLTCLGQAMHGLCFGCFLAAAYIYVDKVSPLDVRGSMQTFFGTFVFGLGMFAGGFVSGSIGDFFTSAGKDTLLRSQWNIQSQTGILEFTQKNLSGESANLLRDWPGIWLSSAAIALFATIMFWVLFPKAESSNRLDLTEKTP